jgi:tetratricopeptide (TPR) repeat protein
VVARLSSNPGNQLKIYEQGGHGTNLFPVHKELEPAIVTWFEQHLITVRCRRRQAHRSRALGARVGRAARAGWRGRALAQVREARKSGKTIPLPPEGPINAMGYEALQGGRVDDAIGLFELNVELHPQSANVYDSLGDAYLAAGKNDRAAELAKKTLEILSRDTAMPMWSRSPSANPPRASSSLQSDGGQPRQAGRHPRQMRGMAPALLAAIRRLRQREHRARTRARCRQSSPDAAPPPTRHTRGRRRPARMATASHRGSVRGARPGLAHARGHPRGRSQRARRGRPGRAASVPSTA